MDFNIMCGCNPMHCRLVSRGYMGVLRGTIDPELDILNPSQYNIFSLAFFGC
jgi:hypothetical protein